MLFKYKSKYLSNRMARTDELFGAAIGATVMVMLSIVAAIRIGISVTMIDENLI